MNENEAHALNPGEIMTKRRKFAAFLCICLLGVGVAFRPSPADPPPDPLDLPPRPSEMAGVVAPPDPGPMLGFPMFTATSMEEEAEAERLQMEDRWTDNNRTHARYLNPYQVVRDDWLAGIFLDANGDLDGAFPPLFAQAAAADDAHTVATRDPDPEEPTNEDPEGTTLNTGRDNVVDWLSYLDEVILQGIGADANEELELAGQYWDEFCHAHAQADGWLQFCNGRLTMADSAAADLETAYKAMATELINRYPWYALPYDPWNDPSPYEDPDYEP